MDLEWLIAGVVANGAATVFTDQLLLAISRWHLAPHPYAHAVNMKIEADRASRVCPPEAVPEVAAANARVWCGTGGNAAQADVCYYSMRMCNRGVVASTFGFPVKQTEKNPFLARIAAPARCAPKSGDDVGVNAPLIPCIQAQTERWRPQRLVHDLTQITRSS